MGASRSPYIGVIPSGRGGCRNRWGIGVGEKSAKDIRPTTIRPRIGLCAGTIQATLGKILGGFFDHVPDLYSVNVSDRRASTRLIDSCPDDRSGLGWWIPMGAQTASVYYQARRYLKGPILKM